MASGIKTLQSIKKTSDNQKPITVIDCFSHKPSALLSNTIKQFDIQSNHIPEKQLKWAKKICRDRKKIDSSTALKLENKTLPISLILDWKVVCHLRKIKHKLLPVCTKN